MENHKISENIIRFRKEKGLTQSELAEEINYSDKVISKWERGESLPNITALEQLSNYFDVTTDELLGKVEIGTKEVSNSRVLEVICTKEPSWLHKWSIMLPLGIWIYFSFQDIMYFVLAGLIFVVLLAVWGFSVTNSQFESNYKNHKIKVTVGFKGIHLYLDDVLVDSTGYPFGMNFLLSGKIGNVKVKSRITITFFASCKMYIE